MLGDASRDATDLGWVVRLKNPRNWIVVGRNFPTDPVGPASDLESSKFVFELEGMRGVGGEAGPGLLRSKGRTVFLEKANFLAQVQMEIRG